MTKWYYIIDSGDFIGIFPSDEKTITDEMLVSELFDTFATAKKNAIAYFNARIRHDKNQILKIKTQGD